MKFVARMFVLIRETCPEVPPEHDEGPVACTEVPPEHDEGLVEVKGSWLISCHLPLALVVRYSSGVSVSIVARHSKCFLFQVMMASTP